MNWSILITFGIVIGVYLLGLLVFVIVKAIINKKKVQKEIERQDER